METKEVGLWGALALANREVMHPAKAKNVKITTKTGRVINFSYADLTACMNAAGPILAKYGLAVSQSTRVTDSGNMILVTTLGHASGQTHVSECVLPTSTDMKEQGGFYTYLKRYQYCAVVGIAADEDLDADLTEGATNDKKPAPAKTSPVASSKPKDGNINPASRASADLGDYVIPFGKYSKNKGNLSLSKIPTHELANYGDYLFREMEKEKLAGKKVSLETKNALDKIDQWLGKQGGEIANAGSETSKTRSEGGSVGEMQDEEPPTFDDIPF